MPKSSQELIFLSAEQLELIHAGVLAKSGGLFGTRSPDVLMSLETKPQQEVFGRVMYQTVFDRAAVYAETIISQHPFVDGNKRTGMIASFTFLEVNGCCMRATDDDVFDYALHIATKKPDIQHIAEWLEKHSAKKK